jgi:hypothetical protein
MTKPVRSPILGYNHNIQFHGHVFHVQTEDSGTQHARVFTHLFVGGTILASKKEEYDAESAEDAVKLIMQKLHKSMIRELKEGVHDARIQGFFAARGEMIEMGDRPSLVQVPSVGEATPAAPAAAAPAPAPAAAYAQAPVAAQPAQVDDRPAAVSGSIDTPSPPLKPAVTPRPMVTPQPVVVTAPPARKVVVVKPPDLKRPPVVVSSSAEGVVVKRNVVINVGGGAAPVQGQISRGTAAPRPAVPYVVRDGSYPQPTVSRGSSAHSVPPAAVTTPTAPPPVAEGPTSPASASPSPSAREIRMPWDAPPSGPVDAAIRARAPGVPSELTPTGRAVNVDPGLRTRTPPPPTERAFSTDLPSDKSLDEVILEYLSDDAE